MTARFSGLPSITVPGKAFSATVCVIVVAGIAVGVAYVFVAGAVVGVAPFVVAENWLVSEDFAAVVPSVGVPVTVFVINEVIAEDEQAFKSVIEPAAPAASPAFLRKSLREIPLIICSLSLLSVI